MLRRLSSVARHPDHLPRPLEELPKVFSEEQYAATLVHGRAVHQPFYHPRTHDIPVANIHFRSHHPRLLDLFTHFASHAASALAIPISKVVYLPTQRSLWTVPKSPFIYKKSQENFERRVHKRAIKAWDAHPEVIDRWAAYLRRHALGGVGMRVVKWNHLPLGYGATHLAGVLDALDTTPDAERIKQLGKRIVREEMNSLDGQASGASTGS